jgi:hypothetical protein
MTGAERPVAASTDELLVGATARQVLQSGDSKSGALIERVVIDGDAFVAKRLCAAEDWTMRGSGDLCGRTLLLWRHGLLDRLPDVVDHTVVAVAHDPATRVTTLLMRDVGRWLVPEGDDPISMADHRAYLDAMVAVQATFHGWRDEVGLATMADRYLELSPLMVEGERQRGHPSLVPRLVGQGWDALPDVLPSCGQAVRELATDPSPLVEALSTTPTTLVHGNWKLGNLGRHPDGRVILLDWECPGAGAGAIDLAWYLAINSARLPESKEAAISAYTAALAGHGIDGDHWLERQLTLALLGGFVQFGWEKALGGPGPELAWWEARARAGLALLG